MPIVDYSKSIIYQLCCKDTKITDIYIGSTTSFRHRKVAHKSSCCNEKSAKYNLNVYKFIRENGGWENWDMVMLYEFSCENKLQLLKEERVFIENMKPSLNLSIPTRTQKEWSACNKERLLERQKKYDLENKERFRERHRGYGRQKGTCDVCGKEMYKTNIYRHKRTSCIVIN